MISSQFFSFERGAIEGVFLHPRCMARELVRGQSGYGDAVRGIHLVYSVCQFCT